MFHQGKIKLKKVEVFKQQDLVNAFRKHSFFSTFDDAQLEEFLDNGELLTFSKNEMLIGQDDMPKSAYYIIRGLVKIFVDARFSKTQIVNLVTPHMLANMYSVFGNRPSPFSMSTVEDSLIFVMKRDYVQSYLEKNPELLSNFAHFMSDVGASLTAKLILFSQKNIKGKVAYVLLYLYKTLYNEKKFRLPISRKEYAQLAGMSTENVIRTLSEFNKEGILKVRNREVEIIEIEFLEKIASFG